LDRLPDCESPDRVFRTQELGDKVRRKASCNAVRLPGDAIDSPLSVMLHLLVSRRGQRLIDDLQQDVEGLRQMLGAAMTRQPAEQDAP
jgi:hypothetical protein